MARKADHMAMDSHIESMYRRSLALLTQNRPLRARSLPEVTAADSLSQTELAALQRVGANLRPWQDEANDPLTRTVTDYMALLESSYSTREVADFLKVDASRIRQRIRERSLYGLEYEGEWYLPRFQFERNRVLPGLAEVLGGLRTEVSALDVAEWFLNSNADLEVPGGGSVLSPREWLLRGLAADAVAGLAREL